MRALAHHEWAMIAILALLIIIGWWGLERRNKAVASKIQLDDLLLGEDGRISKAASVMMGSFGLTSWVIIWQTINGALTEWMFTAYMGAWVLPTVTKLIKGPTPGTSSSETTIVQSTVTEKVPGG